jgi:hypothetical protein
MLGYSTYKISRGGSHIAWYARDLGCAMLRAVTTFGDGASELKAVSVHAGDPPESLFRADTLREVAPSVLYSLHGIEAVTVDSFYRAHQK